MKVFTHTSNAHIAYLNESIKGFINLSLPYVGRNDNKSTYFKEKEKGINQRKKASTYS